MKVLFVCSLYYPHAGGIETIVRELSSLYIRKGIEVSVLTKRWPIDFPELEAYEEVKIYRIISAKTKNEFLSNIEFLKRNNDSLKSDIIHVIGVRRPLPLLAFILSRYWKVPLIISISGGDIPDPLDPQPRKIWSISKEIVKPVIIRADWVNTFSEDLVKLTKNAIPELSKISLIYAGLDLGKIRKIKKYRSEQPYILSLRRLDPSKGVDITIKAFAKISKKNTNIKLIIVGDGTERRKLEALVEKFKIKNRVEFTGKLNLEKSLSLLKGALLTVVPSVSEGGGLINLEAQACRCPLIASRVGGIPEYAKENYSALMFTAGDINELSDIIQLVINDGKLRNQLIINGEKYVKKFSWNNILNKYLNGYNNLLTKKINYSFQPWSNLSNDLWKEINL